VSKKGNFFDASVAGKPPNLDLSEILGNEFEGRKPWTRPEEGSQGESMKRVFRWRPKRHIQFRGIMVVVRGGVSNQ